jgi:uncharacterized protein YvpB
MTEIDMEIHPESHPKAELSRHVKRQPLRVRLLGVLFCALVVCDLFVLGIMLDWPAKIVPAAVQVSGFGMQLYSSLKGNLQPDGGLTRIDPQPDVTQAPIRATRRQEASATAVKTATAFAPQTYTPTASPTATATATATRTPLPTATETATTEPTATEEPPQPPEEEPAPVESPPDSALVEGVMGYYQSLPLSCESRSAVDWARFFGVEINELEFQYALPFSDNPDLGFVGDPRDAAGGIPPHSYGVHAGPVAALLRAYGLAAEDHRWLGYDDLRWEIASGRPAIVWVIGSVWAGSGVAYTAGDGQTTTVAALEHTVMVVGYTPEVVIVQDGGGRYQVPVERFLSSWGALENMAVIAD